MLILLVKEWYVLVSGSYLMRVEIWVENNDCIRAPQIDANASSSCCQDKYEYVRILSIEFIHILLALLLLYVPILESVISVAKLIEEILM